MSMNTVTKPDIAEQVFNDTSFNEAAFDPRNYLGTYYPVVQKDEAELIDWQATVLDRTIRIHLGSLGIDQYPHQLEIGSGPAIHHLPALEKYSKEIHLTEYLPQNLAEIKKWVNRDPEAHDWTPFGRAILEKEGLSATDTAVEERLDLVRRKIVSYGPLDLKKPTKEMQGYRTLFGTSFFVADSATDDKEIFTEMTRNAFAMIEPRGLFVAAYLGECEAYAVGDEWVKSANLNQADLEETFGRIGAENVTVARFDTPELAEEGFDHIFTVTALAKATRA